MFWYFDYDQPLFRPPSEARSLIFQITYGCSRNRCTFCGMYKMKRFRVRPVDEIRREIELVPATHRARIQRIFLADGDALIYPQPGLLQILELLDAAFPALTRIGCYASPNALAGKSRDELEALRQRKLRILYFGLESGDDATLALIDKGFTGDEMLALCRKAQQAEMKLSVTAILGLAGRARSREHAEATADWVNRLSPDYFSLLTMFRRNNGEHFRRIEQLSNGEVLEEALLLVRRLDPQGTILRSNHVSNSLLLEGRYPRDRERVIAQAETALQAARRHPDWYRQVPDYEEEVF
ncbi:radical SAM family protein [Geothermobacter ehrlichii]|uniref:Radical SAM family protein n=1 Tax=Geothermobacter ehrlichii TaxID=213224 RepID=A0A5D3WH28_9BACT|nr:radical SAM protein [Geothermobacter ehrlichii]TYO96386.1 radical SAM family protein [Geothermobacter ehrlichii]